MENFRVFLREFAVDFCLYSFRFLSVFFIHKCFLIFSAYLLRLLWLLKLLIAAFDCRF